jgi:pilus assembly protein CpaC
MTTQIRRRVTAVTTVIILAVFGSMTVYTQAPPIIASTVAANSGGGAEAKAAPSVDHEPRQVRILVGRSTIVEPGSPVTRVSLTSADIADVVVTSSSQLLLNGKTAGTTSMFVWDRGGVVRRFEIVVQRDVTRLSEQLKEFFPGEAIEARSNGTKIVLAGTISSKAVGENAVNLAAGYVDKKDDVVSLLQQRDNGPSSQVLLRVRFAEVDRSAMRELGATFVADGYKNTFGRVTTQQFPAPDFSSNAPSLGGTSMVFSDFLNLFLFDAKNQLGVVIKALQTKGLFQSLAEPNLVAESGKEASFLAGGEFPVPVAQGAGSSVAITVQYKEFGIRLNFLPVVNGNRVHLKVRPEVSTLDFANAVVLQGFRIPSLNTRRTETELELENGQTFAIAGLMSNSVTSTLKKIPGIGDIPILGLLFQSKAAQKDQSELVVMITPEILPRSSSGVTSTLPRMPERYLEPVPEKKAVEPPPPAFTTPRISANPASLPATPAAPVARAVATPGKDTPASAAATVQALTPNTRRVINDAPANQAVSTQASAPVAAATPIAAANVSRPLTASEQKRLDRARKQEQEKAQRDAEVTAKLEQEQARQRQEQAARDAELSAKLQREQDKRDAATAAKAAKAQAEADRKRQKALSDAANNKTQQ